MSSTIEQESEELELDGLEDEEDDADRETSDMEVDKEPGLPEVDVEDEDVTGPVANHLEEPNQQNKVTVTEMEKANTPTNFPDI